MFIKFSTVKTPSFTYSNQTSDSPKSHPAERTNKTIQVRVHSIIGSGSPRCKQDNNSRRFCDTYRISNSMKSDANLREWWNNATRWPVPGEYKTRVHRFFCAGEICVQFWLVNCRITTLGYAYRAGFLFDV